MRIFGAERYAGYGGCPGLRVHALAIAPLLTSIVVIIACGTHGATAHARARWRVCAPSCARLADIARVEFFQTYSFYFMRLGSRSSPKCEELGAEGTALPSAWGSVGGSQNSFTLPSQGEATSVLPSLCRKSVIHSSWRGFKNTQTQGTVEPELHPLPPGREGGSDVYRSQVYHPYISTTLVGVRKPARGVTLSQHSARPTRGLWLTHRSACATRGGAWATAIGSSGTSPTTAPTTSCLPLPRPSMRSNLCSPTEPRLGTATSKQQISHRQSTEDPWMRRAFVPAC